MTTLLRNRWLWIGIAWAGAVVLCIWNHHAIDSILSLQAQNQGLRSELTFQQQNARKLDRLRDEHSKLFLPAESAQLAVLFVKGLLADLASRLELKVAQMTIAPLQKGAETAALSLSFSGPFERILHFLTALQEHRFLQHGQVAIKLDPKGGDGTCDLSLRLRCRVQAPALDESRPNDPKAHSAL
jgi:hypothetical protein